MNAQVFKWNDPKYKMPEWTGFYLVRLHSPTDGGRLYDIVNIEESPSMPTYLDGSLADHDEWDAWAEFPETKKEGAQKA